jgi:multiple sugar transport system ATP-binding protein
MAQVVVPGREAAEVSHVEALGNEQLVTCRLLEGSHLVLVRATPEQSVSVGQAVHLEIDPGGWRLFAGEGVALPRPKPPGEKPLELPQFQA